MLWKSLVVVVIAVVLLFVPAILGNWINLAPVADLVEAAKIAVALLAILMGAHYQLQNLERKLLAERKKDIRQQKLDTLEYIGGWLEDVSAAIGNMAVLRELSEKDESDGVLIIPPDKRRALEEELLRLEIRGYTVLAKLAETGDNELIVKAGSLWTVLGEPRKAFERGVVLDPQPIAIWIAEAQKALGSARMAVVAKP